MRIAVAAAGINFADIMARMGLYPDPPPLPGVVVGPTAGRPVGVARPRSRDGHGTGRPDQCVGTAMSSKASAAISPA